MMPKSRLYEFEGRMLLLKEIAAMMPCYHINSVARYLKRGYKSKQDILGLTPEIKAKKAMSAAAKKTPWKKAIHFHILQFNRA